MLGFARDLVLANVLGAGASADAFFVAFKLPNFFRRMLAEGTLHAALIPVLARAKAEGEAALAALRDSAFTAVLLVVFVLSAAGIWGMPVLLRIFAPGFVGDPERWPEALQLGRIMFPYLALIVLTALFWAFQNAEKRFAVPALTPALLNVALLWAGLVVAPRTSHPAEALAWGVIAGGVLQLVVQLPALARIGALPRLSLRLTNPHLIEVLRLFGPALASIAAVQINILVGTVLATWLPAGAVAALYYADRLVQLPLALFGIALSTALLPALSELYQRGAEDRAKTTLAEGLAWLVWIVLPAAAGLIWLAEPIIRTLFEHGRFTAEASVRTAAVLAAYALGLVAYCWIKALSAACYAKKDAHAPMRYAFVGVGTNILLAIVLMWPLEAVGLALATSIAAWVQALLLWRRVADGAPLWRRQHLMRVLRAGAAVGAMLLALALFAQAWALPEGWPGRAGWLAAACVVGALVYLAAARALGEKLALTRSGATRTAPSGS